MHPDRQAKENYEVLQGALQSLQCDRAAAVGLWRASEKGLSAFGGEKGHELHLSEDAGGNIQFLGD